MESVVGRIGMLPEVVFPVSENDLVCVVSQLHCGMKDTDPTTRVLFFSSNGGPAQSIESDRTTARCMSFDQVSLCSGRF